MALRVRCRCGKTLKISSQLAGRKVACPACKQAFRIAAEKFQAAERDAMAPAISASISTIAPLSAAAPAPEPVSLDDELMKGGEMSFSQSDLLGDIPATGDAAPMAVDVGRHGPVAEVTYAHDARVASCGSRPVLGATQGPARAFWSDAFYSFIYPVKPAGNAVTLVFIMGAAAVDAWFSMVFGWGLLMLLERGIIFGWLASVYLSVVSSTAAGSDDLPGLRLEDGFLDGIVKPAFKFIGAFAIVFLPAIVLGVLIATGAAPSSTAFLIPIWLFVGVFLIPIVLLLFSFDCMGFIFRPDLIVTTILRSLLPYLAIWLMLLIVTFLRLLASAGDFVAKMVLPDFLRTTSVAVVGGHIAISIGLAMFGTYMMIVSMRIIGLYYLHFKQRFTMELE